MRVGEMCGHLHYWIENHFEKQNLLHRWKVFVLLIKSEVSTQISFVYECFGSFLCPSVCVNAQREKVKADVSVNAFGQSFFLFRLLFGFMCVVCKTHPKKECECMLCTYTNQLALFYKKQHKMQANKYGLAFVQDNACDIIEFLSSFFLLVPTPYYGILHKKKSQSSKLRMAKRQQKKIESKRITL